MDSAALPDPGYCPDCGRRGSWDEPIHTLIGGVPHVYPRCPEHPWGISSAHPIPLADLPKEHPDRSSGHGGAR